jgi:hypothetical protein
MRAALCSWCKLWLIIPLNEPQATPQYSEGPGFFPSHLKKKREFHKNRFVLVHNEISVILKSIAFILSNMSEVIVQIPDDLGIIMRRHASINWSNIASEAIRKTAAEVELFDAIASESRLTEEDALALGKKVRKGMWEKVYKNLI